MMVCVCASAQKVVTVEDAEILKAKGAQFVTLIHPYAIVGEYVEMGEGCIINGRSSMKRLTKRVVSRVPVKWNLPCTTSQESIFSTFLFFTAFR